jgi:hypothetical protein
MGDRLGLKYVHYVDMSKLAQYFWVISWGLNVFPMWMRDEQRE